MTHIQLYDLNMNRLAILQNATNKGYTKKLNNIWQASFSLPANDPKVKLCTPFRIIELFDGDERVDLFRILPSTHSSDDNGEMINFECEHVLATLTDDILFQYHEQTNQTTTNVLSYILTTQSSSKWKLGTVDFNYQFSYKWESENLLSSLFSITEPFLEDHQWTWDTTSYPWTLNLIKPSTDIKTWIRYGRNLRSVEKKLYPNDICTRMYGLGYGEGVNQLTIKDVNSGLPYVESDTVVTYGVKTRIYSDPKEENPATLKAKMLATLEQLKMPKIEYSVNAAHIYQITKKSIDDFYLGANCRCVDKEEALTFTAKVVSISKNDIDGNPGDITIEIANKSKDITDTVSSLMNKQRINEVYAQGSTNILAQDFADNCDAANPAVIRFYIPEETVHINKMLLNYKTSNFRAYSKATKGGGSINTTTLDGGGLATTSAAGGATIETSEPGVWTLDPSYGLLSDYMEHDGLHTHGGQVYSDGSHNHDMYSVCHTHDTNIPNHYHNINLPDHDHEFVLQNHTHNIEYGIYLYQTLPTSLTVSVDNHVIPELNLNEDGVDLVPYLEVDQNGRIKRGVWHTISITPDNLARIEANIITQLFIQSRGGGNY